MTGTIGTGPVYPGKQWYDGEALPASELNRIEAGIVGAHSRIDRIGGAGGVTVGYVDGRIADHVASTNPHPVWDDGPEDEFIIYYQNGTA